jgi:phage-related minor tail protein
MANRIAGITIELNGNTTKLQDSLKGVNKSIKETQTQLKDVNKLLKIDPGNTDLLKQKQELLSKSIADTKEKLEQEKAALEQLKNSDGSEKTKKQQEALTREIIATEDALNKLEAEYKEFGSVGAQQVKAVGDKMQEVGGKIKQTGENIKGFGQGMTTHVTAPIVAVGAASLAAFNEVDGAVDILITKTGASGEALEGLTDIVNSIATTIPTSFETAGTAVGEVNTRFGVTGEELEKLSTQFIQFAEINGTDVNNSIDVVSQALAAFGLDAKDAGAMLDTLNKVGQDTGISVDALAQSMTSNATALQSMGLNASDSAKLLGELDKAGIDASVVMTGFSKVQKEALEDGVSMQDKFAEALSSSESAIDIFGSKAGPKLYESFQNGTLSMEMFTAGTTDLNDSLGSVEETFNATLDPTDELTTTLNELKLAGAELGGVMQEQLVPIIQNVTNFIRQVKDGFSGLDDSQKQLIVTIGAVIAVVGPIVAVIGTIVSVIGTVVSAIGTVVSAIGGFIGAAGGIAGILSSVGSAIGAVVAALGGPLTLAIAAVIAIVALLIANWETVKTVAIQLAQTVAEKFTEIKDKVTEVVTNVAQAVSEKWNEIKSTVTEVVTNVYNTVKEKFEAAKKTVEEVVTNVYNTVKTNFENVKSTVIGVVDEVKKKIEDGFNTAKSTVESVMNTIKSSIETVWNNIMGIFKVPHFKVVGELDLKSLPPKLPSLGIDWYAKAMDNGVILNKPTLFGAGEAGAEAIIGVNSLQSLIRGAVSESVTNYGGVNVTVYGAPGQSEEKLAEIISRRINSEVARKGAAWR